MSSSFYGSYKTTITQKQVDTRVANHVIASKTQPTTQKDGDIWLILKEDYNINNEEQNG